MTGWYGLIPNHQHPTVDAMWKCRLCMAAHRKWCGVCRDDGEAI